MNCDFNPLAPKRAPGWCPISRAVRPNLVPIGCVTDDCDAQTMITHTGNAPFKAALFLDKGWEAMYEPGERTLLYMCPKCIAKTIAEVEADMGPPRRSVRR